MMGGRRVNTNLIKPSKNSINYLSPSFHRAGATLPLSKLTWWRSHPLYVRFSTFHWLFQFVMSTVEITRKNFFNLILSKYTTAHAYMWHVYQKRKGCRTEAEGGISLWGDLSRNQSIVRWDKKGKKCHFPELLNEKWQVYDFFHNISLSTV